MTFCQKIFQFWRKQRKQLLQDEQWIKGWQALFQNQRNVQIELKSPGNVEVHNSTAFVMECVIDLLIRLSSMEESACDDAKLALDKTIW